MVFLVTADAERETFYGRELHADAASGELVFDHRPTDSEIRERANDTLAAPPAGDFNGWGVDWE